MSGKLFQSVVRFFETPMDAGGAIASLLCSVHCAASGLWLAITPLVGIGLHIHFLWDAVFYALALFFGYKALRGGYRRHGNHYPWLLFALGIILLGVVNAEHAIEAVAGHAHEGEHSLLSSAIAVSGGLLVASSHWANAVLRRSVVCSS